MPTCEPLSAFLAHARSSPDAIAVRDGDRVVTYGDLLHTADRLRADLVAAGVEPGGLVAVALPRGWQVVAAITAIWLQGCGYVPIDPDYPADRQRYMVRDSGVRVAVAFPDAGLPDTVRIVAPPQRASAVAVAPPASGTPAYVIYTSGSTGDPKGVEVPRSALAALFGSCGAIFRLGPTDVWSWFHSHSFDFSVWEIWGALSSGGTVVVVPPSVARSPAALLDLLAEHRVTVFSQVPSAFRHVVRAYQRRPVDLALRYVVFGGEALDRPSVRSWLALRPDAESLVDMYGITETTVHVTYRRLRPHDVAGDTGGTRIGEPLAHLDISLLDPAGRRVPDGEVGEIHVSGGSLALGYRGRPDLTAKAFPVLTVDGETRRWYRSGDLALRLPDGSYEYLGRVDRQIALRGFRIEPGEVEAVLRARPGVVDAVVETAPAGAGELVLVAYVVLDGTTADVLRQACRAALPAHLVPDRIVPMERIPLTPSGKLDHARLPGGVGRTRS